MKKLLITFVLLLTTLLTFGQDEPYYIRAESFELGEKNSNSIVVWDDSTFRESNVLIKLDEHDVTIYSKTEQHYHVISFDGKTDNGSNRWYCSDSRGKTCNIYLMALKSSPGYMSLTVEFSDFVWFYVCKSTK